ncbi:MAG TPA: sigma-70 family RNA polymerase sigma factor [Solirubrobacteraceae bacterium]|nr:sigma-70 family RNA polymerase sigma factor [Solirubrobacteraceae bacterium]
MTTSPDTTTPNIAPAGEQQLVALVTSARVGDQLAWSRLVQRLDPKLRRALRPYRLAPADVDDVLQSAWTLLYRKFDSIRDPAAVTGWLVTTVRREALHLLQRRTREVLTDDLERGVAADETPEATVLEAERRATLLRALESLNPRQRRLVTLLAAQPALDYAQVGVMLHMPLGSIGPTRARGLARLQRDAALRSLVMIA